MQHYIIKLSLCASQHKGYCGLFCDFCASFITPFPFLFSSEKATSAEHSEPDWEAILEMVEEVKTKSIT